MERDLVRWELRQLKAETTELTRLVRLLVDKFCEDEYPKEFNRIPEPRRGQVRGVWEFMKTHPGVGIPKACAATYEKLSGGYPNCASLRSYCYARGAIFRSIR